jgi:spermidine/putrescine-binding protein
MAEDIVSKLDPQVVETLSRIQFLKRSAVALGGLMAAPTLLSAVDTPAAEAAAPQRLTTFSVFGPDYATISSWSGFKKATGMSLTWKPIADDVGVFVQQVVRGGAADNYNLLHFDGGVQDILGPKGYMLPVDTHRVAGWDKIVPTVRNNPQEILNGKPFGIPAVYNADSFGYYPKDLGRANSFKVLFDDTRTHGLVALEDNWLTSLPMAASYLTVHGIVKIHDPSNMTPTEVTATVDYLIHRKKAGQFRAFWTSWEESVNLLGTREVLATNCWEPAIRALKQEGKPVDYAWTKEGYNRWMSGFWIPRGAVKQGILPDVYRAVDYFLGGQYGAHVAALRGYATGRPDLAAQYVRQHPNEFSKGDRAYILQKYQEIRVKYASRYFWQNAAPTHRDVIEAEWERFKQA